MVKNRLGDLGAFSISLAVKDLAASKDFYEKLGFTVAGGDEESHYLIMRSGTTNVGLFQGMFEQNILTFNPGWVQRAEPLDEFTDIREVQRILEQKGLTLAERTDENTSGPASFILMDPDGNPILFDQHR